MKNWVLTNFIYNTVKYHRVDIQFFAEEMGMEHCKMFQKVDLGCSQEWHCQGVQISCLLYLIDEGSNLSNNLLAGSNLILHAAIRKIGIR